MSNALLFYLMKIMRLSPKKSLQCPVRDYILVECVAQPAPRAVRCATWIHLCAVCLSVRFMEDSDCESLKIVRFCYVCKDKA